MSWLRERVRSFGYAFRGVGILLQEPHARLHLLATVAVLCLGGWFELSRGDWQALVLTVAAVWLAEGMNTALEYLCDAAVPEQHPLIARAKDVAAAAVLITAGFAVVMAGLIFVPYF